MLDFAGVPLFIGILIGYTALALGLYKAFRAINVI